MPPKKRGRGVPTPDSKPRSINKTPSTPLQCTSNAPSPASRSTAQSLSGGPSGNKAIEKVGALSPTSGQTVTTRENTIATAGSVALSQSVGSASESAGGGSESTGSNKSNLKKKVVKKVVRKVKKDGAQPELVDANSNMKVDLETINPIVDSIPVPGSEPSLPTSPIVPTEVVTTTSEPLTSGSELNAEKSNEATESTVPKGKVKKVIRKVIKKKIVKKMVPKSTLAAKKAAEEALGSPEEYAKLGDVETNKAGEEMEKSIVRDANPCPNPQNTKAQNSPKVGEDNKHTDKKSTVREVDSRGNHENNKDIEKSKETIIKIEEDKTNDKKSNTDSMNIKEIKEEMKVGDEIQKEKSECNDSNNERKVRKVIKKRIIKKLVPKGTLLAKSSEENLNVPNSETKNHNPKHEEALGEKPEAENPCPNKEEEKPRQGSVTTTADKISQNPNSSSNADADETDGLSGKQRRRKTEIFIGGLDKEVEETDIRTVFGNAGEIVEVRMFTDNNTGKNKGYCFLRYKEPAQAKKAISMFSKVEIRGKRCGAAPVEDNDSIFLGNINKRWKKDDIIKMLKDFGIEKIDCVTVMQDPQNPELNRGFAFLDLETNRDAQIAFKKLKAGDFSKGGHVRIDWAEPWNEPDEEEMLKVKSVFVECIPSSWDKAKMSEIFEKFGEIERVVLSRDIPSSKRKDYAFVNYTTREAAVSCIKLIEKEELIENGSKVNIKVSLAKPVSKGKMTKRGERHSASDKEKHKILQSNKSSIPDRLRVLRDPAPRQEIGNPKGKALETYRHGLHGEKRGISALSDGPEYSVVSGFPRPRYDNSYHGLYGSSTSSYGVTQPYGIREPSSHYQNPSFGYAGGSFDGKQSYHPDASEIRERAVLPHGHRSWPYPR